MILETDMAKHFDCIGKFKSRAFLDTFSLDELSDKILILQLIIKCADIGHSSKDWDLHYSWSMRVVEEFFK